MFKKLNQYHLNHVFIAFMIIYMMIHFFFMNSYMYTLVDQALSFLGTGVGFNKVYKEFYRWGHLIYVILGCVFWMKPKVILPIFLVAYFMVQAPLINGLNWHDQHVAFLTMIVFTISYFKEGIDIRRWVLLFLSMFFLGAGLGKLHAGGWEWMDGNTAQFRFLQYYVLFDAKPGLWIANNLEFCKWISVVTVFFEIAFPLCLFVPKLEKVMVGLSLLFLTTIYVTMKINFFLFLVPVYLVFLPWENILSRLGSKTSPA